MYSTGPVTKPTGLTVSQRGVYNKCRFGYKYPLAARGHNGHSTNMMRFLETRTGAESFQNPFSLQFLLVEATDCLNC